MKFSEIAGSLGITEYPEKMDIIYQTVKEGREPMFDRAMVDRHHRDRELFGEHYEDVVRGLEDIQTKPEAYAYAQVAAILLQDSTYGEARFIPMPEPDGSPALDMLPLFVLLPAVDRGIAEFQKRGASREQAEEYMTSVFRADIIVNVRRHGRPGLDKLYFNWILLYIYGLIFPCGGFQFNLATSPKVFYILKNKQTGQVAVLLHKLTFHRSGHLLGSAGMEDPEGSFYTEVTETDEEWTGFQAGENGLAQNKLCHYPKTVWEMAVAPGDAVMAIHLPGGMKLDKETTRKAIADAFAYAAKYYADYAPKALRCNTWMLNPDLKDILGEGSNIVAFASLFHLHPLMSDGQGVFNFVFKTSVNPDLATLPEDTRLQRGLKAKYLAGGYHHDFGGYILASEQ